MSIKRGGVRRLMENSILNFHFVFLNTSLNTILVTSIPPTERGHYVKKMETFIVSLLWIWIACMQCMHCRIPGLHKLV